MGTPLLILKAEESAYFLVIGVESALGVLGTQYHGEGDDKSLKRVSIIALYAGLLISALLTIVCAVFPKWVIGLFTNTAEIIDTGSRFLRILALSFPFYTVARIFIAAARSAEYPRLSLYIPALSLVVNALLNYLLIYGKWGFPALGVMGAGYATLIARVVECALATVYIFLINKKLNYRVLDLLNIDIPLLKDYIKCALPILAGQLVWAANNFFVAAIMARVDGGSATASVGVANSLYNLTYTLMNGVSSAVGVITAKTVGTTEPKAKSPDTAKDKNVNIATTIHHTSECHTSQAQSSEKIREYARTSQLLFLAVGLLSSVIIFLLTNPFIALYKLDGEDATLAVQFIRVILITFVGTCYSAASLFGIVKSGGDVRFVFLCDLAFLLLVTVPAGLITFNLSAPAWCVFAALKAEHILKCPVAMLKISRYNWIKKLTRSAKVRSVTAKEASGG